MADEGLKLERWEEEQLAAIARDATAIVRNRILLQHAAEAERAKQYARAEAAEKRAQDAERVAKDMIAERDLFAKRLQGAREIVGGGSDLLVDIRALKARCEAAEQSAIGQDGSAYVRGLMRDRDEAKSALAACQKERDEARGLLAAACEREQAERVTRTTFQERALAAESALAERNREIDGLKRQIEATHAAACASLAWACKQTIGGPDPDRAVAELAARFTGICDDRSRAWADLRTVREEAASIRAQLAERDEKIKSLGDRNETACEELVALRAQLATEQQAAACFEGVWPDGRTGVEPAIGLLDAMKSGFKPAKTRRHPGYRAPFRAQAESLRGEPEPEQTPRVPSHAWVAYQYHSAHHEEAAKQIIASLPPSPSPKTGQWKCRRCGKELLATAWAGSGSRWMLSLEAGFLIHWCEDNLVSSPADRIGDAQEGA